MGVNVIEGSKQATVAYKVEKAKDGLSVITYFVNFSTEEIALEQKIFANEVIVCSWAVGLLCAAGTSWACYGLCGVAAIINVIGGAGCAIACGIIFGGGGCIAAVDAIC